MPREPAPGRWLLKSEPAAYSIRDLERDGRTSWEGVRNYQARNLLRDSLRLGDLGFFYHSSVDPPGVAGVLRIASTAFPDPTQFDPQSPYFEARASAVRPRWWTVQVEFVERFRCLVPLARLKATPELSGMMVVRAGARLSVQPVSTEHFAVVLRLGRAMGLGSP